MIEGLQARLALFLELLLKSYNSDPSKICNLRHLNPIRKLLSEEKFSTDSEQEFSTYLYELLRLQLQTSNAYSRIIYFHSKTHQLQ